MTISQYHSVLFSLERLEAILKTKMLPQPPAPTLRVYFAININSNVDSDDMTVVLLYIIAMRSKTPLR